jgi:ABC-type branched-subunit amino acid transport system substrate-binding protein
MMLLLPLLALLLPTPAWAGKRLPDVVDDAAAFATTDRTKAIALLESAYESAAGGPEAPVLALYAGEHRRLQGDLDPAHLWFTRALTGDAQAGGELGLALVAASRELDAKTLALLQSLNDKGVPDTQNADRYLILAQRAAARSDASAAAGYAKKALAFAADDPAVSRRVTASLAALTQAPPPPPMVGGPLVRAEAALAQGDRAQARQLAEAARAQAEPDSADAVEAAAFLQRLDAAPVSAGKIVVLLPLSGKFAAVGSQVKDALTLGWQSAKGPGALVFVDSGATSATAVAALEQAALRDGAVAVIGPLLTDEAEAVATAAERLHLPLVSLAQGLDDVDRFGWVFQAALTPRQQIEALVGYLAGTRGMDAFGIFSPSDDYGTHAAGVFREVATARGATVSASQSYPADANVFTDQAQALARQDDPKDNLSYDALFLPENAKRVPLAAAALAMEEFPMGTFAPHPNIRTIPLIGLSGWNNPQLVTTGNEYTRGSFFTDVFLATATDRPAMTAFTTAFKAAFNRTPTAIEAAAADAARTVAAAASGHPADREAFRAALLAARPADTATGVVGFDATAHTLDREILVLSIQRSGISVVASVPPQ